MLWIKSLHIFFVICWMAGVFYLPRIFVNLAMENSTASAERLLVMARKLPVRRDRYFQAVRPLSEYVRLAQENGAITD